MREELTIVNWKHSGRIPNASREVLPSTGSTSSNSLCSLSGNVSSLLNTVTDGWSSDSVGQRQLAVMTPDHFGGSNIVTMGEATAAVNAGTDDRV